MRQRFTLERRTEQGDQIAIFIEDPNERSGWREKVKVDASSSNVVHKCGGVVYSAVGLGPTIHNGWGVCSKCGACVEERCA